MKPVNTETDIASDRAPQHHRTIDRVTSILEQVVYTPGMTFAELSRAVDAPKSSVYGFMRGLVAAGWLHQDNNRFYLGPALYGLTLASGHLRAGAVSDRDLHALHEVTGTAVFLGVQAGDDLIYVAEVGAEKLAGFAARSNIRRQLLETAGGKILLAEMPAAERDAYLRRRRADVPQLVDQFLAEFDDIVSTRVARNLLQGGTRFAMATAVRDQAGRGVAEVTLVGKTVDMTPRADELAALLLKHVDGWQGRRYSQR
jgi:DNA-binding IclR family transcriptional regulator